MINRRWRVIIVRHDGRQYRYGNPMTGRGSRGQGIEFVSELAAQRMADSIATRESEIVARCFVEAFQWVPPEPPTVSPLTNPPRFN